MPHRNINAAHV